MSPEAGGPPKPAHREALDAGKQAKAAGRYFRAFEFVRGCGLSNPAGSSALQRRIRCAEHSDGSYPRSWPGCSWPLPSVIARGLGPNPAAPGKKKIKGIHHQEVQSQRSRLKQSRKTTRAEARSAHHANAPKAGRHSVRKVQRKASPQNPELRQARRQNRSREKTNPKPPSN